MHDISTELKPLNKLIAWLTLLLNETRSMLSLNLPDTKNPL